MTTRIEKRNPDDLKLPDNYKASETDLANMIESVKTQGLLHAPLIKENGEVFVGKLRVIACRALKIPEIEVKVYQDDLDQDEYKIISLHENLKRYNLPWYEQVLKEKELHELRQDQHGVGKQGKKVGWSLRDTADELSMAVGVLSENLRMADAILCDPSLTKIQDKTTARRVILERIKRINQEITANTIVPFAVDRCYNGSSEVILDAFPDRVFDVCLTDPPWLEFKDPTLVKDAFTLDVFKQVYRVLKNDAFLLAFVSTQDWIVYQRDLTKIGFEVQKWPLIWVKENVLTHGSKSWQYQRNYEPILVAVKGSPALTSSMVSAVISCPVIPGNMLTHPNEKPTSVIERLLLDCTYDNSLVLDPFSGSFVVADVCKKMGRRFIAIEKDPNYYVKGCERLGVKP